MAAMLSGAWAMGIFVGDMRGARANEPSALGCAGTATRANVVECALRASVAGKIQAEAVSAAKARKIAAEPLLPKAPVLEVSVARRSAAGMDSTLNLYATLTQEIELAGQRGQRIAAAEALLKAEEFRLSAIGKGTAFEAWSAYFRALGAGEQARLYRRAEAGAKAFQTSVRAYAAQGSVAGVDESLAEAAVLSAMQIRLSAERNELMAKAALGLLWGRDPKDTPISVEGELLPLAKADALLAESKAKKEIDSPLALALDAEQEAFLAKVSELRRSRVPNLSLQLYAQRDGFRETVLGVGISMPIPLPEPLTNLYSGEIAEARALAAKAGLEAGAVRNQMKSAFETALLEYQSRLAEVNAFGSERLSKVGKSLEDLESEVAAGRMGVREALPLQKALLELLVAHTQAKLALCLASVNVLRAEAGVGAGEAQ